MKRPLPPPTARQLQLAVALAAVAGIVAVAGVVGIFVWASNSGAGWLSRAVAASERFSDE